MLSEIIAIGVSILVLFLVYFARVKSPAGKTFLFSERFLNKADEIIFDLIKFVYKMHELLFHNISVFLGHIPHKIMNIIHKISHAIAKYSSDWIEKITHKHSK
jgi:hypothetical protein